MKCANCEKSAIYYHETPAVNGMYYCVQCLPDHLRSQANNGTLDIPVTTPQVEEPADTPAPSKSSRRSSSSAQADPAA